MGRYLIVFVFACAITSLGSAQQHVFTNKEGVQIIAEIVSVSPNWKKMTIRKDGNSFDIEPNVLILDDQQFVKNWLKERGVVAPGTGFKNPGSNPVPANGKFNISSLKVEILRNHVDSKRRRLGSSVRLESKIYNYDIKVTNRGRVPVPPLEIEYALVWNDRVPMDEARGFDEYIPSRNKRSAKFGEKELQEIPFNHSEAVLSDSIDINSITHEEKNISRKDELIGLVVIVKLADGTQVLERNSKGRERDGLTWESVESLKPEEKPGASDEAADDGNFEIKLEKGESRPGPLKLSGKRILISADITPSPNSAEGVIVAIGGAQTGMSLYIKDRKVYGNVTSMGDTKWVAKEIPSGRFRATLTLGKDGLALILNKGFPTKRDDVPLLTESCEDGIDIGTDSNSLAGEYPEDFDFAGEITNAIIVIGK